MAKVLVYEGGLGTMDAIVRKESLEYLKGGAIGAGAVTLADFVFSKVPFLKDLRPMMRNLVLLLATAAGAAYLSKRKPELGVGVGIGGSAICAYKIIQSLLGKVVTVPTSGYSGYNALEVTEYEGNKGSYGVLTAEPEGNEEYIIEEY